MFKDAKAGGLLFKRAVGGDLSGRGNHDHLTGFDFAHKLCADDVEGTGLRRESVAVTDAAQNEGPDTKCVTHTDQLGPGHCDDGKGAFDAAQGVFHPLGDVFLQGARHQVDDAFTVA